MMPTARACAQFLTGLALIASVGLGGCASLGDPPPRKSPEARASIFGPGGLRFKDGKAIFGTPSLRRSDIEVNLWLWRAALEMSDQFGVSEADPWGGTVMTKWQDVDHAPEQRVRLQTFILGPELISENLAIHLFVERRSALYTDEGQNSGQVSGQDIGRWSRMPVSAAAQEQLKLAMLTRAWDLRSKFQAQQ